LPVDILLADDDPDSRSLLRDALNEGRWRCAVHEVSSGVEALDFLHGRGRFARAPRPALVCLDIEMPLLSGLKVLSILKADPLLRDIPVIVISSVGAELAVQARSGGACACFAKPVHSGELLAAVRAVLASGQGPAPAGAMQNVEQPRGTHDEC
jgi:CheY-like chemotaxis protein